MRIDKYKCWSNESNEVVRTGPVRRPPEENFPVKRAKTEVDIKKDDEKKNIQQKVQFQLKNKQGPSEEEFEKIAKAKEQCFHIINYHGNNMRDVVVSRGLRETFHIFPRTTEECQKLQMDSTAYGFSHKEASLGKDYCWLRNLEREISAMKLYAESGDCDFVFQMSRLQPNTFFIVTL